MRQSPRLPPHGVIEGQRSREEQWAAWVYPGALLASPLLAIAANGDGTVVLFLPAMVMVATIVWWASISYRQLRRLERIDYRMCLECRYVLAGMPVEGRCPECGALFDRETLRRSWRWTYGVKEV